MAGRHPGVTPVGTDVGAVDEPPDVEPAGSGAAVVLNTRIEVHLSTDDRRRLVHRDRGRPEVGGSGCHPGVDDDRVVALVRLRDVVVGVHDEGHGVCPGGRERPRELTVPVHHGMAGRHPGVTPVGTDVGAVDEPPDVEPAGSGAAVVLNTRIEVHLSTDDRRRLVHRDRGRPEVRNSRGGGVSRSLGRGGHSEAREQDDGDPQTGDARRRILFMVFPSVARATGVAGGVECALGAGLPSGRLEDEHGGPIVFAHRPTGHVCVIRTVDAGLAFGRCAGRQPVPPSGGLGLQR